MPKHRPPRRVFAPRTPGRQPGVPHFRIKLRESAATAERTSLVETTLGTVGQSGRMLVQLISAGWGSSGHYSPDVLREAARTKRFPIGLHLYMDHPGASEEIDRPERSVHDLAAVLTEDARYDDTRKALVAEAKPLPTYRELLGDKDFLEAVGLSIRAGGLAEYGQVGDRKGLIVKEITEAQSVDFVTKAGRGGKVLALLESARTKLAESPTEQIRVALERAVRAAYGVGEHRYAWIRDFDPDRAVAWFDTDADGDSAQAGTWEQAYATNGIDVALLGPRRQVTAVTVYRPVAAVPDEVVAFGESAEPTTTDVTDGAPPTGTPTQPEEGSAMAETSTGTAPAAAGIDVAAIQIEAREAVAARDKVTGERDTALQEAAAQKARADNAEAELALFRAVESARPLIAAQLAESGMPAAAQNAVTAYVTERVPLTESRQLDQNALRELVEARATAEKAYVAQLQEAAGAGQVSGFGQAPAQQVAATSSWATPAVEPNAALVEAYRARGLTAPGAAEAAARGRAV